MLIDPNRVEELFRITSVPQETKGATVSEGAVSTGYFSPERLKEHRQEIEKIVDNLSSDFKPEDLGGGGGMSFVNLCLDAEGDLWTGSQSTMEKLVLMAVAINKMRSLLPKEFSSVLPGGMPYFIIT